MANVRSTTTGSLTATGSVTLTKPHTHTMCVAHIAGTYGTVTFVFEGSLDGTNYFALHAYRHDTGALVTGTVAPTDNAEQAWLVPCAGLTHVRARVTAISSGTAAFHLSSASYQVQPLTALNATTFGATTFGGDVTLSGAELTLNDVASVTATGSAQGDAAALPQQINIVAAADGTKGVVLPAAAPGVMRLVYNTHASNGLKVYPASGDDINDGTQDAAVTVEGKTLAIFVALDTSTYAAIFTANS